MSEEQIEARERMRQTLESLHELVGSTQTLGNPLRKAGGSSQANAGEKEIMCQYPTYEELFKDLLPQFPKDFGKMLDDSMHSGEEEMNKNEPTIPQEKLC
jgi:hypothetical protein